MSFMESNSSLRAKVDCSLISHLFAHLMCYQRLTMYSTLHQALGIQGVEQAVQTLVFKDLETMN